MRLSSITLLWIFVFSCSKGDSDSPNEVEPKPVVTYNVSISSTEGGSVNTQSGTYNAGTVLTITATPNDGYEFIGWTGSNETSMEIMIVVNSNIQLTANFQLIPSIEFTVTTSAGVGGIVSEGGTFSSGTVISVVATPTEGYKFTGWTGSSETSSVLTTTISSDLNLSANFSKIFLYNSQEYSYVEMSQPPYGGTIFITGNIITSSDNSVYDSLVYKGTDNRLMYDRRNGGAFINNNPFLYDAYFSDGLVTEIQVNSEFSVDQSLEEAEKYSFLIGQLSKGLRKHVETMWIHKGIEAYGGGNNNRDLKITIRFLSPEIRSDALKIIIHERVCSNNVCSTNLIDSKIASEIQLAILKKAALLEKKGIEKLVKERRKKDNRGGDKAIPVEQQ